MTVSLPVSPDDVRAAARRLKGFATKTPLLRSVELDRVTGGEIYVKAECLQLSGSFKFRGAYNRISQLSEDQLKTGVVAFSSGNHGQGVALAAKMRGIPATIVMPEDAPKIKMDKTRSHGAEIVTFNRFTESREEIGAALAKEKGAVLVPSFDDVDIIAGQGTSALEAATDLLDMGVDPDAYIINVGGGGLTAGSSVILADMLPNTKIYTAEPEYYDDHARSFKAGKQVRIDDGVPESICDALLAPQPGDITFQINKELVTGGLVVSETEVKDAMVFAFDNLKIVIEPGGAVSLAAVLTGKFECKGKKVVVVVSGGNVDKDFFREVLVRSS